jgi:hypothetical protein
MGRTKAKYDYQKTGRLTFFDGETHEILLATHPVVLFDDFLHPATDATNDWTETDDSGTSAAGDIVAGVNGLYQIDTGTDADRFRALSSELCWEAAKACGCEVRLGTLTSDANLMMVFGFTDAKYEASHALAFTDLALAQATVDSVADDAVMFGVRAETNDNIYALSVKANGTPQSTDSGVDLVLTTYHIYRIQLDTDGNARFYIDGVLVAEHLLAVTTTDDLCFAFQALITAGAGTAAFINIDYIKIWQERS